jgi:hypothetical protein
MRKMRQIGARAVFGLGPFLVIHYAILFGRKSPP